MPRGFICETFTVLLALPPEKRAGHRWGIQPVKCLTIRPIGFFYMMPLCTFRVTSRKNMPIKKCSERCKHCVLAVVRWSQKNSPHCRPLPGVREVGQNIIGWRRSLPLLAIPVWWGSMHTISSYRGNRPSHTQTHPQTGPITKITAQCKYSTNFKKNYKNLSKFTNNDITISQNLSYFVESRWCHRKFIRCPQ